MNIPSQSTLAGGLSGLLATWLLPMLLTSLGITVPPGTIAAAVTLITAIAVHVTPDSIKNIANELNVDIKDLAAWLPTVQAIYPNEDKKP